MSTINFSRDIRIFGRNLAAAGHLGDVAAQVAAVERLPTLAVAPGLTEAKAHLMEVCEHLLGETTFQGQALELHAASVCSRAFRLAQVFACEDLAAERSGRRQILDGAQWRIVHRALLAGCAGQVPVLRRLGTFQPPIWALDLLELTTRLAEVGWGPEEVSLKARVLRKPDAAEKRAAAAHGQRLISAKERLLAENPEAREEAAHWAACWRKELAPAPRPEGFLAVCEGAALRMPETYRRPVESAETTAARAAEERRKSGEVVTIRGWRGPYRAHREVVDVLAENRRMASAYARSA